MSARDNDGARPSVSVVVPVYNSEASLPELARRLEEVLLTAANRFEVILVNDGSLDGSWDAIRKLVALHTWVRGINLMRNYGQHNALLCGIRAAQYEVVVTMDDDLQHPPEELPKLLLKLRSGYDVVYGVPLALVHSGWRNLFSKYTKLLLARAVGVPSIRALSAFRAFRCDLRAAFVNYQSPQVLLDVLLSWGTARFGEVGVAHEPRKVGRSNYNFLRLTNQALLMLTGFSTGPLRMASLMGCAFTIFGMLVLAYVLVRYFVVGSLPGFTFTASMVALLGGAQLFGLGIIGEYLARMFSRTIERPIYVVRETAQSADVSDLPDVSLVAHGERVSLHGG